MTSTPDLRSIADGPGEARVRLRTGIDMFFRVDDFTDPWTQPETIVLLHGVAESGVAWFGWLPHLARTYRVLRPDLRGFGMTTPMPVDHPWTLDELADDLLAFLEATGLASEPRKPHFVAAKVAGMMALHFAQRHPGRLASLCLIGSPVKGSDVTRLAGYGADVVEQHGVGRWAANGQAARLGTGMPPQAHDWWTAMMAATPASTQAGFLRRLGSFDATQSLEEVDCPTLVITNGSTAGGTASITSAESVREWQERIPESRLLVMPGDSYHTAASDPDRAAIAVREFIESSRR